MIYRQLSQIYKCHFMRGKVDDIMLVKICGIQTVEAAQVAVEAGANFLGFMFAPSKRQILPEKAMQIAATVPSHVKKVGVFVNESKETIIHIAKQVGLDMIQLHGDETAEFTNTLRSEEHTSELQSRGHLVCRLLLEKKKKQEQNTPTINK